MRCGSGPRAFAVYGTAFTDRAAMVFMCLPRKLGLSALARPTIKKMAMSTQPARSHFHAFSSSLNFATASLLSLHNIQHDLSASHSPFYRYSYNGVRSHFGTGYSPLPKA